MYLDIDRIFEMLSCDNDLVIQQQGIELAKNIRHLSVLMRPVESKLIWENCAKVLASKCDNELEFYIIYLFEWLKDMNWPGADIIYRKLKSMPIHFIKQGYLICYKTAITTRDFVWQQVLEDFRQDLF